MLNNVNYKVLIIRPNTTIQIQYINLLLYSTVCFGRPYQPSSGKCRIHTENV